MDLHLLEASPTDEERAAVDALFGPNEVDSLEWGGPGGPEPETRVARRGALTRGYRHSLLPALHALQSRVGWISPGGLNYVCERLDVPPAEAYGVATFYAMFSVEPRPVTVIHVCDDLACRVSRAKELSEELEGSFGAPGTPGADGATTWVRSPCLGMCEQAPALLVQRAGPDAPPDVALGLVDVVTVGSLLERDVAVQIDWTFGGGTHLAPQTLDPTARARLRLLRRVGVVDPTSIDDYRAHGGYAALRRARELGPEGVIAEVTDAKLLGRGGAAFPTGVKWKAVAEQPVRPHYFICNADESEPGTFKDRIVTEHDPFAVIEALTIAGYATGCEQGYLYIRGEYPLATARLEHAIAEARRHGFLGADVMGEGFAFDIELRRGAGAYICGEETALFNSIEGKRGEPRNKPPFPVQVGLFGKPTLVNNVETLVNVLDILDRGAAAFAATGTQESTGTRLFCVSGHVRRPGLYEVPMGTTLRALIELAGGLRQGRSLQAVLLGGAAGSFVTEASLDVPLSFEGTRAIGATLGSGAVIVLDETAQLKPLLLRIAKFFRDESCGQCVPCRVGTVRQEEILERLLASRGAAEQRSDISLLSDVAQAMRDASICGLGQTAANAIASAVAQLNAVNMNG